MSLKESFEWMGPEFKVDLAYGKNTVRIRGVAMRKDVISTNNRKYVKEELVKSARTWNGKPLTINHDKNKPCGHIEWMEYNDKEDALEYVADIEKQPYVDMLRNKSATIRGVSIGADYLHILCPRCNRKFYTEEEWYQHVTREEYLKDIPKEPHGMIGRELSLVLSPETPGYGDTSIELMEMYRKPVLKLLETITQVEKEKTSYMSESKEKTESIPYPVTNKPSVKETAKPKETVKVEIPKEGILLIKGPNPTELQTLKEKLENRPPLQECTPPTLQEIKLPPKLPITKEKLTLGEPFGGYTDFADCVAKNRDKDNPEAYCGTIKHQTEGEMQYQKRTAEFLNGLVETITLIQTNSQAIYEYLQTQDKNMATYIQGLPKDDLSWKETIANLPKDDTSWKDIITTTKAEFTTKLDEHAKTVKETIDKNKADFEKILAVADKNVDSLKEYSKSMEERVKKAEDEAKLLKEANAKKLQETADLKPIVEQAAKDAKEAKTIAENVEDKLKPEYKGKTKPLTPEQPITDKLPYNK